jgi:CheY-like chemotaxis protein
VEETADLYAEQARAKGLSMNVSVSDDLRQTVMGDAYRLGQILNNLIGNAVKFTNVGGLYIRAESLDQSADSLLARFEIKDTGIGIAEATLPVIFDDFVQANGSTTREYGGTGLGLSISRRLCSLMGGEIAVQSRPGVGSVFSFTVRFRKTSAAAQQVRTMPAQTVSPVGVHPAPEGAPSAPVGGAHILLAEDNLLNMELAQAMLHSLGCSVVGAPDGEAAVAAYAAERFDMVLMDLQMPKMDGLAATGAIRDYERTHGIRTPVLALTAHALPGDRDRSLAAGLDDHLTKPVSFAVLEEAIRNWVRKPAGTVAAPQATMPAIDANQVIDAVAIERLREVERAGNAGLLRRVLQQFLDGGDAMIRQMEAAITSGDAASIRQATHTLKSNSAYLGAERLRLRCLDLEQAVETGATTQLPGLLDQIKTEYTHASESLAKLLQETAVA